MKFVILLIFTSILSLTYSNNGYKDHSKYISFQINKSNYTPDSFGFYQAVSTGNKNKVKKSIKDIFKRYGLMHLMTPSGIHLSSVLILFKFSSLLSLILCLTLFIYLFPSQTYNSLERVLLFRIIYGFNISKNIEYTFLTTLMISILIGHLSMNPLSYIFSLAFWGTVVIYRNSKGKLILHLNFMLYFMSSLFGGDTSILSLIINPLYTSIVSGIFPILLFNNILPASWNLDFIISPTLNILLTSISMIVKVDTLPLLNFTPISLLVFFFLTKLNKFKLATLIVCLSCTSIQNNYSQPHHIEIINLGHPTELLYQKGSYHYFIDQKCKVKEFKILCKKRPSRLGGPIF